MKVLWCHSYVNALSFLMIFPKPVPVFFIGGGGGRPIISVVYTCLCSNN